MEALKVLKQKCGDAIPVIIITGDPAPDCLVEAKEQGHLPLRDAPSHE